MVCLEYCFEVKGAYAWTRAVLVGRLPVAFGFFLHMARAEPGRDSAGVLVTNLGAGLLALATLFLAYLIIAA